MSTLMDGINNAYSLTAQINTLRSLDQNKIEDPNAVKYALEQNFNKMLNDLISSTQGEEDEDKSDPFSYYLSGYQESLQGLQARGVLDVNSIPDTSSPGYLNALYNLGQLY